MDDRQRRRNSKMPAPLAASLPAGTGGSTATPIAIFADAELTGVRIFVDDDQAVLPIDAIRLFSADSADAADRQTERIRRPHSARLATRPIGDRRQHAPRKPTTAGPSPRKPAAINRPSSTLEKPLEGVKGRPIELMIYQNLVGGQHSLGKFRISVTERRAAQLRSAGRRCRGPRQSRTTNGPMPIARSCLAQLRQPRQRVPKSCKPSSLPLSSRPAKTHT